MVDSGNSHATTGDAINVPSDQHSVDLTDTQLMEYARENLNNDLSVTIPTGFPNVRIQSILSSKTNKVWIYCYNGIPLFIAKERHLGIGCKNCCKNCMNCKKACAHHKDDSVFLESLAPAAAAWTAGESDGLLYVKKLLQDLVQDPVDNDLNARRDMDVAQELVNDKESSKELKAIQIVKTTFESIPKQQLDPQLANPNILCVICKGNNNNEPIGCIYLGQNDFNDDFTGDSHDEATIATLLHFDDKALILITRLFVLLPT